MITSQTPKPITEAGRCIPKPPAQVQKRKVLVTDDCSDTLDLIKDVIEGWGHEAVVFKSKVTALEKLREIKPDLVTTDLYAPVLGGFDFILWVKKLDPSIPVIVISGNLDPRYDPDSEKAKRAFRLGACACLQKPFKIAHLRKIIEQVLTTRASNTEI